MRSPSTHVRYGASGLSTPFLSAQLLWSTVPEQRGAKCSEWTRCRGTTVCTHERYGAFVPRTTVPERYGA